MPFRAISDYRLTPAAQQDLDDIWNHTAKTWSPEQASNYLRGLLGTVNMLLIHPRIGRERSEISPPVRIHPHASVLAVIT